MFERSYVRLTEMVLNSLGRVGSQLKFLLIFMVALLPLAELSAAEPANKVQSEGSQKKTISAKMPEITDDLVKRVVESLTDEDLVDDGSFDHHILFRLTRHVTLWDEMNGNQQSSYLNQSKYNLAFLLLSPILIKNTFANIDNTKDCKKTSNSLSLCAGYSLDKSNGEKCNKTWLTANKKAEMDYCTSQGKPGSIRCNPDWFCHTLANAQAPTAGLDNKKYFCAKINGAETKSCIKQFGTETGQNYGNIKGRNTPKPKATAEEKCNHLLLEAAEKLAPNPQQGVTKSNWFSSWSKKGSQHVGRSDNDKYGAACLDLSIKFKDLGCDQIPKFKDQKIEHRAGTMWGQYKHYCYDNKLPKPVNDGCHAGLDKEKMSRAAAACQCSNYEGCIAYREMIVRRADLKGIDVNNLKIDGKGEAVFQPPRPATR